MGKKYTDERMPAEGPRSWYQKGKSKNWGKKWKIKTKRAGFGVWYVIACHCY